MSAPTTKTLCLFEFAKIKLKFDVTKVFPSPPKVEVI